MQVQKRVLRNARGITANMLFVNGRHYMKTRFFLGLLTHLPGFFIKHMESWPLLDFYHLGESGMCLTSKTEELDTTDAYITEKGMLMIAVILRNDLKATPTPERFTMDDMLSLEREVQIRVAIKQGVSLPMTSGDYKDECDCLATMIDASPKPFENLFATLPVPKGEVISIPLAAFLYLAQSETPAKKRRKRSRKQITVSKLNPEAAEFFMK